MKNIQSKREREKQMVSQMIALYCRRNHHTKGGPLPRLRSAERLRPPALRSLPVHGDENLLFQLPGTLLQAGDAGKIRAVMRFSGPRMILYHPVAAVRHVVETKREKKRLENNT